MYWTLRSAACGLTSLGQAMTWERLAWPWPLGVNLDFDLHQTKSISFDTAWKENCDGALALWLCDHFSWSYEPKTKPRLLGHWPGLWGPRLTSDLKCWYPSLRLVTADILFFFLRSSGLIRGKTARGRINPSRPGMKKTVRSGEGLLLK